MKRALIVLILVLPAAIGLVAYREYMQKPEGPAVRQTAATDGDIFQTVTATGTLQATRTVDVGSQVSGVVKKLYVDYNSIVKKGEVIAEIDPMLSQAAVDSAQAGL